MFRIFVILDLQNCRLLCHGQHLLSCC